MTGDRHPCGSPPRAWGQFDRSLQPGAYVRFTPTGVGTILDRGSVCALWAVHPHGRGDNAGVAQTGVSFVGSPPRAWGQFVVAVGCSKTCRFTPTGVGTITPQTMRRPRRAVHPHGRGDNTISPRLRRLYDGSPPRAWGQSRPRPLSRAVARFTPTGVGTMARLTVRRSARPVHPHGRGDNLKLVKTARNKDGSPPRAWGQSPLRQVLGVCRRFTPTGVGTIRDDEAWRRPRAVHPHGRGDNG